MTLIDALSRYDSTPTIGKPCPLREMHICTNVCALYLEDEDIRDCSFRIIARLLFDFNRRSPL
jgi:hypothetical protein